MAFALLGVAGLVLLGTSDAQPQQELDENCTVSILNRTARVQSDGSWTIGSLPAVGRARVRAVCRFPDGTVGGHTDFITLEPFRYNGFDAEIDLGDNIPIADGMSIALATTILEEIDQQIQLTVTADLPGGALRDVTMGETGTNYSSSDEGVATVSDDGLVTAVMSGVAMISARNEGALAIVRIIVALDGDSDGDGIADSIEVLLGMDPDNPADALEDFDADGLTNAEEAGLGTDIQNEDTDFDGLRDGEELDTGTDPLDADSDDDGLVDGAEPNPTGDDDGDDLINALDPDRDNDGLSDGVEDAIVGNPTGANPNSDNDSDLLSNIDEVGRGTDPANRDTDSDGLWDGSEVHGGCDPLVFDAPTIAVGRIVDALDVPVAGARVHGFAHRISTRVSVRSGEDGTFQLPGTAVCGGIQAAGSAFVDGRELQGASLPFEATAGDLTDLGDIVFVDQPGAQFDLSRFAMPSDSNINFRHLMAADFNGDGTRDLIGWRLDVPSGGRRKADELLTVFLGRPDRSFASGIVTRVPERTVDFLDNVDDFDDVDWDTGDFDGDGNLDLVFSWRFERKAAVVLGRGDGGFSDVVRIEPLVKARALAAGDFNEDGHEDLAFVFGSSDDEARIYLGAGDATFALGDSIPVGDDPNDVIVADLNDDGHLDLVTANSDSDDVTLLLGGGNGTFAVADTLAVGQRPRKIVFADANDDAIDDLVILNKDSEDVSLFAGNGDGTFQSEQRFDADLDPTADDGPRHMIVAELTGDDATDILIATSRSSSNVPHDSVLLRANGSGGFAAESPVFPLALRMREPLAVDLNGDDLIDLVDIQNPPDVVTALNVGNGAFFQHPKVGIDEADVVSFSRADVDGDGVDDLLSLDSVDGVGRVVHLTRHNDAQPGTFLREELLNVNAISVDRVQAADIDNDGVEDLILSSFSNSSSVIWTARGLGGLAYASPTLVVQQKQPQLREVRIVDYDDDGAVDIAGRTAFGFFLMNNLGGGTFAGPVETIPAGLDGQPTTWIDFGDLDLDGFSEILIGGGSGFSALPDKMSIWVSGGDAVLEEAVAVDVPGGARGEGGRRARVSDFDGDGLPDVAISNVGIIENALTGYFESVAVLPGQGDGSFGEAILSPIQPTGRYIGTPENFDSTDFNDDGIEDLIWSGNGAFVSLMLGLGNGTFAAEQRYSVHVSLGNAVVALDIDGNGESDIVATQNARASLLLLHR